jgi:hypothetical protein
VDSLRARQWWARASLALAALAVVVVPVLTEHHTVGLIVLATAAAVLVAVAGFWFLAHQGGAALAITRTRGRRPAGVLRSPYGGR